MSTKYSPETKIEAVKLASSIGCAEAAKRLQMPISAVYTARWQAKKAGVEVIPSPKNARKWTESLGDKIEFAPAQPKRMKTGIITEEVIRTVIREKRNQYGEDEKMEALILADMIGAAKAAEELEINPHTIRTWKSRRDQKAKEEAQRKAAEEKENFFKETIVKLTQRVSALEAMVKSKIGNENLA